MRNRRLAVLSAAVLYCFTLSLTGCGSSGKVVSSAAAEETTKEIAAGQQENGNRETNEEIKSEEAASGEAASGEAASGETTTGETMNSGSGEPKTNDSSILIAYFTVPETDGSDTEAGASRYVVDGRVYGNMEYMAEQISKRTGGELFEIKTVQEYPGTHEPLVDQAAQEQDEAARPELASHVEDMDRYEVIFLGFPNWWGDMPMPLYTFLEEYDLGGKQVIPFNSHGGSRFSRTIETIQDLQPGADVVTDGYTVSRNDMNQAAAGIENWLSGLGYPE